jgi:hypothetical protein
VSGNSTAPILTFFGGIGKGNSGEIGKTGSERLAK